MWPFQKKLNLEEITSPTSIDVVARVGSENVVKSPVTGMMAAFVCVEVFSHQRFFTDIHVGSIVFGDLISLAVEPDTARDGGGEQPTRDISLVVDIAVRRAQLSFISRPDEITVIEDKVPELLPLMIQSKGGGILCYREHLVLKGEHLRLRATVERTRNVVAAGYRSEVEERLSVRDDLELVRLDEVLSSSSSSSSSSAS